MVGLHVATADALLIFFWRDWARILGGLATSIIGREVTDPGQRLGRLLVLATIPVGLIGLPLEHVFRVYLSMPVPTAWLSEINAAGRGAAASPRLRTHRAAQS